MQAIRVLTIPLVVLLFSSCGQSMKEGGRYKFVERGGLALVYERNSETPFTGKVNTKYPSGKKKAEGESREGRREGKWTVWYENGQKESEGEFIAGKQEGKRTVWYENGQKKEEGSWRGGKKAGEWTEWHENGQNKTEGEFREGKQEGKWTVWYENGQKRNEGEYRDGKQEGKWTVWYENGQKVSENEFRDGEVIAIPGTQTAFCKAVSEGASAYEQARRLGANKLILSKLRTVRKWALLAAVPNGEIRGWVGTIKELAINREGKAILRVTLPCDVTVTTYDPRYFHDESGTLIPQSSPLYDKLAELGKGKRIMFSARLFKDASDGFHKLSWTEQGNMDNPEFLVRFTDIVAQ